MLSFGVVDDTSLIRLSRFLRKDTIDAAITAMRFCSYLVLALALGWMVYYAVSVYFATTDLTLRLHNDVQGLAATAPEKLRLPARESSVDYEIIAKRKPFGELGSVAVPNAVPTSKPAPSVPLVLIGTFTSQGEKPYAIIEDDKKHLQEVFMLDEKIFDDAVLKAIFSDRVEIERNGQRETLTLDEAPEKGVQFKEGVANLENDEFMIEEAELDKALENLPLLLSQARAVPYFQDGKSVGLRLFAIRSGSLFERLGLLNGDILKSINGNSLADFSQAMTLFQKLKEDKSIGVVLERNKVEKQMKYQIR